MRQLLLVLGVLGGAAWVTFAVVPAECVPPSGATEGFCNRLWTPALLAMTAGFLGVRRAASTLHRSGIDRGLLLITLGAGATTLGNFGEYWLFSTWPHEGPDGWLRGLLWMLALAGLLLVLVASVATGMILLLRGPATRESRGLGAMLAVTPLTMLVLGVLFVGIVSIGASIAASALPREAGSQPVNA